MYDAGNATAAIDRDNVTLPLLTDIFERGLHTNDEFLSRIRDALYSLGLMEFAPIPTGRPEVEPTASNFRDNMLMMLNRLDNQTNQLGAICRALEVFVLGGHPPRDVAEMKTSLSTAGIGRQL